MGKLSENMQTIIDKNDPNQKLIGLLAVLIEDKMDNLKTDIESNHIKLESIEKKLDETDKKLDGKIVNIEKEIDFIITLKKYKWLLILVIVGIATFAKAGWDKLISIF